MINNNSSKNLALKLLNYSISDVLYALKKTNSLYYKRPLGKNFRSYIIDICNNLNDDENLNKILNNLLYKYISVPDYTYYRNTRKQIVDIEAEILNLRSQLKNTFDLINNDKTPEYLIDPYTIEYVNIQEKIIRLNEIKSNLQKTI